jgi:hypothetical protein
MAKRREPGQKEYNPLDDARGRLPIDDELIRAVVSDTAPAPVPRHDEKPHLSVVPGVVSGAPGAPAAAPASQPFAEERHDEPLREEFRREEPRRDERTARKGITLEKLTAYNKFLTTQTEKFEFERFTARVSGALGASVKPSQLIRACLVLLLRAENETIRRAERQPRVKRPSNTEAVALAEFDQTLAEILSQAFRDAGPIKPRH